MLLPSLTTLDHTGHKMYPLVKLNPTHNVILNIKPKLNSKKKEKKKEKKKQNSQTVTNPALLLCMPPRLEPNTKTHT